MAQDYAALAAQLGGQPAEPDAPVDFAALAAQLGGQPVEPETSEPSLLNRALDVAEDWAPTVGAMAGGVAGGVAAPVTAALGGAAGVGARNLIRGLRSGQGADLSATAGEMATEGVKQGALQAVGGAAARGLKAGGTRLYGGLLKPSKAVRTEFPNVVDDLIKDKRIISPGGWFGGGLKGVEGAVERSASAADDLIAKAAPTAPDISAREIVREFGPVVSTVRDRVRAGVVGGDELAKVGARGRRIMGTTTSGRGQPIMRDVRPAQPGRVDVTTGTTTSTAPTFQVSVPAPKPVQVGRGLDITEAQRLKKAAQAAATGAYRQMRAGNIRQLGTDDLLDAATARGLRGAMETRVPGLRAANQATQRLIGQERALADAVGRTGNHLPFGSVSDLAAMGAGVAGGPLTGLAAKASTMAGPGSAAAIALYQAGRLPHAQLLRILAQMAHSDDPE